MRVLIADDMETERDLYAHAFRKLGLTNFEFVHDGQQVIEFLKGEGEFGDREKHPFPDWLLLDLKMPKATGMDVLHWLYHHAEYQLVPTIMMSNSNLAGDVEEAYRLGVNAFFTKPTSLREMMELLQVIYSFWTRAQRPDLNHPVLAA